MDDNVSIGYYIIQKIHGMSILEITREIMLKITVSLHRERFTYLQAERFGQGLPEGRSFK